MSRTPPVPGEQRSPAGPGADPDTADIASGGPAEPKADRSASARDANLKSVGRAGNSNQNTQHQGHQQDR